MNSESSEEDGVYERERERERERRRGWRARSRPRGLRGGMGRGVWGMRCCGWRGNWDGASGVRGEGDVVAANRQIGHVADVGYLTRGTRGKIEFCK